MNVQQCNLNLLRRVCKDDADAMDFLSNHWSPYVHEIDDIIDGERTRPADIISTFARAAMLFSHPFYLKHWPALRAVVLNITSTYADTVAWEKSPELWQRQWADMHRHCSNEMVLAVAMICGGYDHAAAFMLELRAIAYHEHHDKQGLPV